MDESKLPATHNAHSTQSSSRSIRKRTQVAFILSTLLLFVFTFKELAIEWIDVVNTIIYYQGNIYVVSDSGLPSERIYSLDLDKVRSIRTSSSFFVPIDHVQVDLVLATEDRPHTIEDARLMDLIGTVVERYTSRALVDSLSVISSLQVSTSYLRNVGLSSNFMHQEKDKDGNITELILPEENVHGCIDVALKSLGKRFGKCASCKFIKIIGTRIVLI